MKTMIAIAFILINSLCYGQDITLRIGESIKVHKFTWAVYCGMLNDNVFSIKSYEYRQAVNLYYPKSTKNITLGDFNHPRMYVVLFVTPYFIRIKPHPNAIKYD